MNDPTATILHHFEEINAIPRCSLNEAALGRWLQQWAEQCHLSCTGDKTGNLVVRVPGTTGYESAPTVVLQGHLDMVCEKTPVSAHDFTKDPIVSHKDGDWLTAGDTTLGADNGIAIAYMMALAEDDKVAHPPLELLFTVDEETGLNGAKGLEPGFVQGRLMINLDSEDEGVFTIGCAGGVDTTITLDLDFESSPSKGQCFQLVVGGLSGGHSGIDIHKHRGNANKILVRLLAGMAKVAAVRLLSIDGGSRKNAIPRDAKAEIWTDASDISQVESAVEVLAQAIKSEYHHSDRELTIELTPTAQPENAAVLTAQSSNIVISLLQGLPNGVTHMSSEMEGLVDTSCNLATVFIKNGQLTVLSSQRSASESRLDEITATVHAVAALAGGATEDQDAYPPWQPRLDSTLLARTKKTYRLLYNREPVIQVIHAGLECAVIGDIYSGMDMISVGPTIENPHSPNERVWIPSIEKVWRFLVALLSDLKD